MAQPARSTESDTGRIAVFSLNLRLDLIQWLHDIEAGRSSIGPCQRSGGAAGEALIAHLELRIEKFKRELHGRRSERSARLLEQLELELEELVTTASEDELAAQAAAKTQNVRPFTRKQPVRTRARCR
nr:MULTISPECIES: hypothetical protein [unclassified Bradyrhizobium]